MMNHVTEIARRLWHVVVIHLGYWIHGRDVSMFVVSVLPCCSLSPRIALRGQPYSAHLWTERFFCIVVTAGIPWGSAYLLLCLLQTLHNLYFPHEARIQCYRQRFLWFTTIISKPVQRKQTAVVRAESFEEHNLIGGRADGNFWSQKSTFSLPETVEQNISRGYF